MSRTHRVTAESLALGRRLEEGRLTKGLTPNELGISLNLKDGQQIRRWERGEMGMSLETVRSLAGALDVTPEWLMDGRGHGPNSREQDEFEAHVNTVIRKYQTAVDTGINEDELRDYWRLVVYAYELLEAKYPTIERRAQTLARITAGIPPTTRRDVEQGRTHT